MIVLSSNLTAISVAAMHNDRSVPLSEALQHFSDPSDWKELVSLQRYAMMIMVLGGPETEDERRHRRYHRLKARLEADLLAKLSAGSLQATGFECPVGLDDERRLIRAEGWAEAGFRSIGGERRRWIARG